MWADAPAPLAALQYTRALTGRGLPSSRLATVIVAGCWVSPRHSRSLSLFAWDRGAGWAAGPAVTRAQSREPNAQPSAGAHLGPAPALGCTLARHFWRVCCDACACAIACKASARRLASGVCVCVCTLRCVALRCVWAWVAPRLPRLPPVTFGAAASPLPGLCLHNATSAAPCRPKEPTTTAANETMRDLRLARRKRG